MIAENKHRLVVNINDLRRKKPARAKGYVLRTGVKVTLTGRNDLDSWRLGFILG